MLALLQARKGLVFTLMMICTQTHGIILDPAAAVFNLAETDKNRGAIRPFI